MTRTTHSFEIHGEVAEVYNVIATPEEWANESDSRDPRWSIWRNDSLVIASRLTVPVLAVRLAGGADGTTIHRGHRTT